MQLKRYPIIRKTDVLSGAVSRSESGQQKALLLLDAAWREVERIPLDMGARHFSLASAAPALPADLRAGDRCGAQIS